MRYLHSDIDTVERVEIIRDLRLGEFDVLVGINLLREGLDIPEVSLVAILDADKEASAFRAFADPDHRPRGAPYQRHRHPLRDRVTDSMRRRSARPSAAAREADRPQPRQRHRPRTVTKRIKDIIDGVHNESEDETAAARASKSAVDYAAMDEKSLAKAIRSSKGDAGIGPQS